MCEEPCDLTAMTYRVDHQVAALSPPTGGTHATARQALSASVAGSSTAATPSLICAASLSDAGVSAPPLGTVAEFSACASCGVLRI